MKKHLYICSTLFLVLGCSQFPSKDGGVLEGPFQTYHSIGDKVKIGFMNEKGGEVIKPQFDSDGTGEFHEGMCLVKVGDKYGYIDKTGKIVINLLAGS